VVLGLAALAVALAASSMMAGQHLGALVLPGCGVTSRCAAAAASPWGTIPGVNWPVSFVGTAYFAGALVAWAWFRGVIGRGARWVTRAAGAASLLYIGVMLVESLPCGYCLTVHAANVLFVAASEWIGGRAVRLRPMAVALGVFLVISGGLGIAEAVSRQAVAVRAERDLAGTTRRLTEPSRPGHDPEAVTFTGRYRWGPEAAPIRIVVFSDYQCPDCKRIEGDLMRLVAERSDLSISVKQFPFCSSCNRHLPGCPHPNACWAARAAEAAGIIRGPEGFRQMHGWLFSRGGGFTDAELDAALREMGYDPAEFLKVMTGPVTLDLVRADIEEGVALGLAQAPFIFINGVELKGWNAPDAIRRAVEALAATKPPAKTADHDRPPSAADKFVADWMAQPVRAVPARAGSLAMGPANAKVRVVLWGGFQEPFTAEADGLIRRAAASRGDVRYEFRHYPFDRSCNPAVPQTIHPDACRLARADAAATMIESRERAWKFHAALLRLSTGAAIPDPVPAAAAEAGIHLPTLLSTMELPEVVSAIAADQAAAGSLGLAGIPFIFVNGRFVPTWRVEGADTLARMIDEAAQGR
jgi:protein-disulfide isomerase